MARSSSGESVIERVVRIFDAFDPETERLSVGDLARRADLPGSTASRLIDQLVGHGLLHRDAEGLVGMGVRMWELASRASPTRGLREAALPFLEDIHAVVGHHAQLGVLDGTEVLFLERLSAPEAVVNLTFVAGRLPTHASSSGLVLLAHAPPALQERVLTRRLHRYTDATPVDPQALRRLLADVRRTGQVHTPGFVHPDAAGLAVPVRDHKDSVVAAVSVVVPNDASAVQALPMLHAAARGIGRALRVGRQGAG
ncbi:MAG: IclR family transcriptional regulator [Actinomycetales bacterium]|nr:MAG: IclR family transcriptional regulator [Actinomycetales bacterium]